MQVGKSDPLLSILIPSKDRYETLKVVIESILSSIKSNDYEIVVQDNSAVKSSLAEWKDDVRVNHFYNAFQMPISDNIELGIENCRGRFVTIIGDDDFVNPSIVSATLTLESLGGSCLSYDNEFYWWPGVSESSIKNSTLWTKKRTKATNWDFQSINVSNCLEDYLSAGGTEIRRLPRGYHGIVSKDIYNLIKEKFGFFVPASSPDLAIASALCFTIDHFYYSNTALTIYGASKKSGAGMTISKTHNNEIDKVPFLRKNILEKWDPSLPKYWSQRIIYPQSFYEVAMLAGSNLKVDLASCYAAIVAYERHTLSHVGGFLLCSVIKNRLQLKFLLKCTKKLLGRLLLRFKGEVPKSLLVINDVRPEDVVKFYE